MSGPAVLTLPAPAKINQFLHVTGRRSDGYHTLETLLVPIDRCDRVTLALRARMRSVASEGRRIRTRAKQQRYRACVRRSRFLGSPGRSWTSISSPCFDFAQAFTATLPG